MPPRDKKCNSISYKKIYIYLYISTYCSYYHFEKHNENSSSAQSNKTMVAKGSSTTMTYFCL